MQRMRGGHSPPDRYLKILKKVNRVGTKNSVDPFEMFVGVKHEKLMVEGCIFIQIFLFRAVVNMYVNSE